MTNEHWIWIELNLKIKNAEHWGELNQVQAAWILVSHHSFSVQMYTYEQHCIYELNV